MEEYGARIKSAREQAHMTQEDLGRSVGVSGVTIMRYEKCQRQPRIEQFHALAAALNVDVNWLINGDSSLIELSVLHAKKILNTDDPKTDKAARIAIYYAEEEYKEKGYDFSSEEGLLIKSFSKLNTEGKKIAVERLKELTEVPKYQLKPEAGGQDAVNTQEDN